MDWTWSVSPAPGVGLAGRAVLLPGSPACRLAGLTGGLPCRLAGCLALWLARWMARGPWRLARAVFRGRAGVRGPQHNRTVGKENEGANEVVDCCCYPNYCTSGFQKLWRSWDAVLIKGPPPRPPDLNVACQVGARECPN